jgi:hypothetical protein
MQSIERYTLDDGYPTARCTLAAWVAAVRPDDEAVRLIGDDERRRKAGPVEVALCPCCSMDSAPASGKSCFG